MEWDGAAARATNHGDQFGSELMTMTLAAWRQMVIDQNWDEPGYRCELWLTGNRLLDKDGIPVLIVMLRPYAARETTD